MARHAEFVKFAIVGGTTFVIDSAIFYTLKLTILDHKPVTAKVIAGVVAVLVSYVLNREWSFKHRGGRDRASEALLFFGISGVGVVLSFVPLYISSYAFNLRVPNVSLTVENIADFVSAYIIGNILQMLFRYFAFKWFVFPEKAPIVTPDAGHRTDTTLAEAEIAGTVSTAALTEEVVLAEEAMLADEAGERRDRDLRS